MIAGNAPISDAPDRAVVEPRPRYGPPERHDVRDRGKKSHTLEPKPAREGIRAFNEKHKPCISGTLKGKRR